MAVDFENLDDKGAKISLDLGRLMTTRLLVQGSSGAGKSYMVRYILESA